MNYPEYLTPRNCNEGPAINAAVLMVLYFEGKAIDAEIVAPEVIKQYEKEGYVISDDQQAFEKFFEI